MRISMLYGFFAGVMGGALGLGGAIILVPAWLNSGIDKNIAASSSGPLIFFSALVAFSLGFLSGSYHSILEVVFYFTLAYLGSYLIKCTYLFDLYRVCYLFNCQVQVKCNDLYLVAHYNGIILVGITSLSIY
eukprot:GHVR01079636.1.p1 GENE.GHVR01079636.1~~GHVR01079636.1.p1  ORF type:complete len:132 (-),score=0.99 GHVR01079636.1:2722-3117(-)